MSDQLAHSDHKNQFQKLPVILLTDNLMGDANIGSLFRLSDAFNIEKIVFCGSPVNLDSNRLKRTARATVNKTESEFYENALQALEKYKATGYTPVALEITKESTPISPEVFKPFNKILLVVGNERHGISADLLQEIPVHLHIPMFGNNSSMNVSHAAAIAFYEISKTLHSFP